MLFLSIMSNEAEQEQLNKTCDQLNVRHIAIKPVYSVYLKLVQYNPSVIIVEVGQDLMHILEFLKLIRTNLNLEQIPFVLFGPELSRKAIENLTRIGANTYIARPFDIRMILNECVKQIRKHQATSDTVDSTQNQPLSTVTKEILNSNLPVSRRIRLMTEHIEKLLVFPATVANVLRITNQDTSSAGQLAKAISADPSMAAEILRVSNTIFYSRGGQRLETIQDAVVRIGFDQVKHLALSMSILKVMSSKNQKVAFDHNQFWIHSLAVGLISEKLASKGSMVSPSEAFLAGLLHDLGALLFNEYFQEVFLKTLENASDNGYKLITAQKEVLGFSQNELVQSVLDKWNFPNNFGDKIRIFPSMLALKDHEAKEHPVAFIVNVADTIANAMSMGRSGDLCVEAIHSSQVHMFHIPEQISRGFMDDIFQSFNQFNMFLQIEDIRFPDCIKPIEELQESKILFYTPNRKFINYMPTYFQLRTPAAKRKFDLGGTVDLVEEHDLVVSLDIDKIQSEQIEEYLLPKTDKTALIISNVEDLPPLEGERTVHTKYPLDLRNLHAVMMLLNAGLPVDPEFNPLGSLKPN